MSAAVDIELAIAELHAAQKDLRVLIETTKTSLMGRALETVEERIYEALVKLGG